MSHLVDLSVLFFQIAEWDNDYEIEAVFSDCSEDDIIKDEIIDNNYYLPNRRETFMDLSGVVFGQNETLEVDTNCDFIRVGY